MLRGTGTADAQTRLFRTSPGEPMPQEREPDPKHHKRIGGGDPEGRMPLLSGKDLILAHTNRLL